MQGLLQAVRSCREKLRLAVLGQSQARNAGEFKGSKDIMVMESPRMQLKGLENTTVSDVLMTKGGEKAGSWLCCKMDDTVYAAVKQMAQNNIGSLVVLKPGDHHQIAGIITERDYLKKVIVQDRASKYTRVGDIMTDQSKLITVASDTNILQAMQIMTENQIRHVPVVDGKIVGVVSVVDIVRAVVEQQRGEVKQLNEFIRGNYY
ncbi:PREDICTED: CBS domain-containing protein CBSX3, mitochondrial-like [Ipomoea nil]|uniref:CBS domain-containing protein CBSX3, mitochondrial-like n=1 Tax=Ipomoea nil TaxID=35883 RepID=UPI0009013208|nr:PREDICTED: CBS domain-containing protein CBSX3, mitochondrial-like [Ipomoea nil]XP_019152517.1 PREDICTED: CBS domain-containing protein CBSX3, mitochondrial-like [Ipomoea nil]